LPFNMNRNDTEGTNPSSVMVLLDDLSKVLGGGAMVRDQLTGSTLGLTQVDVILYRPLTDSPELTIISRAFLSANKMRIFEDSNRGRFLSFSSSMRSRDLNFCAASLAAAIDLKLDRSNMLSSSTDEGADSDDDTEPPWAVTETTLGGSRATPLGPGALDDISRASCRRRSISAWRSSKTVPLGAPKVSPALMMEAWNGLNAGLT
jgi:hypothetical protein